MNLIYGILWGLVAQVITFLQLQGQMKYAILKNNTWFLVLMGLPISYMFMQSVKQIILAFNGQIFPSRFIGFSIGIIVFVIMSKLLFNEVITVKSIICILLSIFIILVQVFMK